MPDLAQVVRHIVELLEEPLDGIEVRVAYRFPSGALPKNVHGVGTASLTFSAGARVCGASSRMLEAVRWLNTTSYDRLMPSGGFGVYQAWLVQV